LGILIIVISAYILEPLGFTVTSVFLLFTYGMLLGEKRWLRNLILSIIISLFLYLFFGVLLQVNLPRGTVPFLRDFALMLEGLFG
jgi:putative tricarboxylic transport membrane protein